MRETNVDSMKIVAVKQLIITYVMLSIHLLVFVVSAGQLTRRLWIFFGASVLHYTLSIIIQYKLNPQLLAVRLKIKREGSKRWDELLMRASNLTALLLVPAVAGWDIGRVQGSTLDLWWMLVGLVLLSLSTILLNWAMAVNPHFESTVRIQTDRGHQVVTDGPYQVIRHPGYLAGILYILSLPLIIGSLFAFLPVGVYTMLMVVRTTLEDRTLCRELKGYAQYAEQVRYRLFLGVW